jgi:two-component system LytT family response regulator
LITTIIISGDNPSSDQIQKTLESFDSTINVVAVSENIKTGIKEINDQNPDIVILDTYLKDGSGFELLKHFQNPDFRIIFISEYTEYAIKAFDYNSIGYVTKPINDQKFTAALSKAINQVKVEEKLQLNHLAADLEGLSKTEKLILRTNEEIHSISFIDIVRVEAGGNYAVFYISDGRKIMVSKPMKEYEERLLENSFFRIHKSHMVNIKKLKYFDKAEGGYLVMSDGSRVPVASRKRDEVIAILESFG